MDELRYAGTPLKESVRGQAASTITSLRQVAQHQVRRDRTSKTTRQESKDCIFSRKVERQIMIHILNGSPFGRTDI
jgi:hypothetical protein